MPGSVHARAAAFGPAAEAYERGRPGWPAAALDAVERRLGLSRASAVLDLAAGTGKLTRELLPRFDSVTAVEPVDGMRAVLTRVVPGARVLSGTAEAIPLPDGAVDAVFVAEAFHWFDPEPAAAELARVLSPRGGVAVLYNRRDYKASGIAWEVEAHEVFEAHMLPRDEVDPHDESVWRAALARAVGPLHDERFPAVQRTDAAGLEAAYASFSSIAGLPADRRDAALAAIHDVLVRHEVGEVEIELVTNVVTASRR